MSLLCGLLVWNIYITSSGKIILLTIHGDLLLLIWSRPRAMILIDVKKIKNKDIPH
jgi:hypothetical protein